MALFPSVSLLPPILLPLFRHEIISVGERQDPLALSAVCGALFIHISFSFPIRCGLPCIILFVPRLDRRENRERVTAR